MKKVLEVAVLTITLLLSGCGVIQFPQLGCPEVLAPLNEQYMLSDTSVGANFDYCSHTGTSYGYGCCGFGGFHGGRR